MDQRAEAPGAGGETYGFRYWYQQTEDSTVFFGARLRSDSGESGAGLWSIDAHGPAQLIMRDGAAAPGTGGAVFQTFEDGSVNRGGLMMMENQVTGAGVDGTNNKGIWLRQTDGTTNLALRNGQTLAGGEQVRFFFDPWLTDSGAVYANIVLENGVGGVDGSNDFGLYRIEDGEARAIVREGEMAAGTVGAAWGSDLSETHNGAGDILFRAVLASGGGVTGANAVGLWAYDASHDEIMLIARVGSLFDVSDDPFDPDRRIVQRIRDDRWSISDNGWIAFHLEFRDGSEGLFSTRIPSPGTLGALGAGMLAATRRRRSGGDPSR